MEKKFIVRHYTSAQATYTARRHPGHTVPRSYATQVRRDKILDAIHRDADITNGYSELIGIFDDEQEALSAARSVDLGDVLYVGSYNGFYTFSFDAVIVDERYWEDRWGEPSEDIELDWDPTGTEHTFYSSCSSDNYFFEFCGVSTDDDEEA